MLHVVGSSVLLYLIDDARSNKNQVNFTSAFITLTSQTSKRILVPDGRLLRWTCRTRCQNDVWSSKIGNYITCGTLCLSWAFRFALKHFTTSLCLHPMVFHLILQLLCFPVSLFNVRFCYFVICQLVTMSGPLSGHPFCHYFPFFFFSCGVATQRRPWLNQSWVF